MALIKPTQVCPEPDPIRWDICGTSLVLHQDVLHHFNGFAIVAHKAELSSGEKRHYRFIFGPAKNDAEIEQYRQRFLSPGGFEQSKTTYEAYLQSGTGGAQIY